MQLVNSNHYLSEVRQSFKFSLIVTGVFYNLSYKGFCQVEEQEEIEGETEYQHGTGVGEGQGMQDASKQIEFEEQVLGEQMENVDQEDLDKDQGKATSLTAEFNQEEGMDMEADFDGQNKDLDKETRDDLEENGPQNGEEDIDNEISSVEEDINPQVWQGDDDFNEE
jgi:midasin